MDFLGFPSTGNGVLDAIIIAGVVFCVIKSIWTDVKKERDIAHGVDIKDVRKYYKKTFHSRAQREEYLKVQGYVRTGGDADGYEEADTCMDMDAYEDAKG